MFLPKRIYKFIRSTIEKLRVFTTETEKLVNTVNENIQDNCEQNDDDEGMKRCALPEIQHNGNHSWLSAYCEAG